MGEKRDHRRSLTPDPEVLSILPTRVWGNLQTWSGPAQTARSERTREALRQAALVRFLAQGVEDTSAEQIAADAGVSLRTFYRHFSSKHDLLFADYTGLNWFRAALNDRPGPNRSSTRCRPRSWRSRMTLTPLPKSPRCATTRSTPAGSCATFRTCRPISPRRSWSAQRRSGAADRAGRPGALRRDRALHRRRGVRRDGGLDARRRPLAGRVGAGLPPRAGVAAGRNHRGVAGPSFVIIDKTVGCVPACQQSGGHGADERLRRDRDRRRTQWPGRRGAVAEGRAADAVPGIEAVRGRDGLHRRAVRRLPVRDRRLGAVPDRAGGPRASSVWTPCRPSTWT